MKYYDFDEIQQRKGTASIKWDGKFNTRHDDILPLWVADMDFVCSDAIRNRMQEIVDHGIYGYSTGIDDVYRKAVCDWYQRRHQWSIDPSMILYAPGVVAAIAYLIKILSEEGDGIVIQTPVYYPFAQKIKALKRVVVENPLHESNGFYAMDFDHFDMIMQSDDVKGVILCSPHNPVGRVWTQGELLKFVAIAEKYGKWIISDEIHGDIIREEQTFTPLQKLSDYDQIITCTAASKSFNLADLQNSNIIITNPRTRIRWKRYVEQQLCLTTPTSFAIRAGIAAYNESEEWLNQVNAYIDENIRFACSYFQKHLPKAIVSPCEGTYLLWVNVKAYCDDSDILAKRMLAEGVILDEGTLFGVQGCGYERLNLACPRSIVEKCLERMCNALQSI